eukprot:3007686-Alexandrium_andersonii.AAC.1
MGKKAGWDVTRRGAGEHHSYAARKASLAAPSSSAVSCALRAAMALEGVGSLSLQRLLFVGGAWPELPMQR